ncbi:multidrug effflux MFS transporter [Sphingorhabdus wooponensis]|uniref:Bcr/CflA family efflux transporter n=1 Tax=Sphingorhabdus wooponensis TaxID=940136 RepID=A0A3R8Q2M3_9SPHN|nr:multidrug effflux MFS transporter [Sphingorhabdus wooponensis]RRQ51879.1 Bcr/CflA family efflux MFS transporter [Sphingorhabdus wooponensis]
MPTHSPVNESIGPRELTVMMSSLMALNALAIDAMLPAFPAMVRGLGLSEPNHIQYIISIFLAGTGIGALIYGPLSDRYGRKPILLIAVMGSAIASLACSFAPDFEIMMIMRFVHGLLAAAMGVLVISVIRDQFEGDAMARRMSTIFLIFMIVPIIAPTIGQLVLFFAGWRVIFDLMACMAVAAAIWVYLRLPETLAPENVIPIQPKALAKAWKVVVLNRNAAGYMIGAGITQGALFGYLNSSQQMFDKVFNAADFFTIGFAIIAIGIAMSNFTNSRIVERFGARRVSQTALLTFIALGALQLLAARFAPTSLPIFLILLTGNVAMIGFIGSNFSSIAMSPFGHVAGAASSFQTFVRTALAASLGAIIGQQFDGTVYPVAFGFLCCGLVALSLVLWCEKGKLFTRPGTTQPLPVIPRN